MPEPIQLLLWAPPNCWKVTIALEEMALPYALRPVAIGKGEQFEHTLLAVSPNNRVPAIVERDGPGGKPAAIFESGAILQYLGRRDGCLARSCRWTPHRATWNDRRQRPLRTSARGQNEGAARVRPSTVWPDS